MVLKSHARSRSTASRKRRFEMTRCKRGSSFLSGSSSVRRSEQGGLKLILRERADQAWSAPAPSGAGLPSA